MARVVDVQHMDEAVVRLDNQRYGLLDVSYDRPFCGRVVASRSEYNIRVNA